MTILFGRIGSIIVTPPGGGLSREIKGLRFSFNIEKTSENTINSAVIVLFNINSDSRSALEEPDAKISIKAGYSGFGVNPTENEFLFGPDKSEILYTGDLLPNGIKNERKGPDIATTLECGTGLVTTRDSKINKSFGPGTTAIQVIQEVAASMGLSISQLQTAGADVFLNGLSISGASKDVMTKILSKLGVQWSIQDDELHITDTDLTTAEAPVLLSSETGLI